MLASEFTNPTGKTIPDPDQSLQDIEYHHVIRVLDSVGGHKGQACEILKISRPRLQRILERKEG
ncbi:helix-turn-helix domain-containing protein [Parasalinivibrio latis]|uniref:helix-turn-helix domain-containing protein n=1 Tax=Parasalinivibrio latis TaxID=2952610 RepID=UPI0030E3E919